MLEMQDIRELIKLIDDSSIEEFTYEVSGTKIKLTKNSAQNDGYTIFQPVQQSEKRTEQTVVEPVPLQEQKLGEKKEESTVEAQTDYDHEIVSPMVGTFYAAPNPESDPYVSVGSNVKNDTIVCIVEAMKLFNEIEAEVSGEIVEVLVNNGELVEYGQPLFRVKSK